MVIWFLSRDSPNFNDLPVFTVQCTSVQFLYFVFETLYDCAADFSLLNLPKGKSLGRSKLATSSYAQAPQHTVWDDSYYIQALLNCLL